MMFASGTPSGCVVSVSLAAGGAYAQPPANGWQASGLQARRRHAAAPEGLAGENETISNRPDIPQFQLQCSTCHPLQFCLLRQADRLRMKLAD
jgi:hypothetical protein